MLCYTRSHSGSALCRRCSAQCKSSKGCVKGLQFLFFSIISAKKTWKLSFDFLHAHCRLSYALTTNKKKRPNSRSHCQWCWGFYILHLNFSTTELQVWAVWASLNAAKPFLASPWPALSQGHCMPSLHKASLLRFNKDTWAWWMLADAVAQFLVFKGLLFFSVGGFYVFYDFVHLVLTLTLTKLWDSLALGQILCLKCVTEAYYK